MGVDANILRPYRLGVSANRHRMQFMVGRAMTVYSLEVSKILISM